MKSLIAALCGGLIFTAAGIAGAEPVASVLSVRGGATVERGTKKLDAQSRMGIEVQDTVATAEGGRIKLLFIDDSVLTLAEKSRMSVDTFVHSRSDRGKSLFNLLDGKMRAVVGKTRFEVKTPTVVAAARGTVILFEVGLLNGQSFTRVTCLEGFVEVRSLTAAPGAAPVTLSPGQSIVVVSSQATSATTSVQQKQEQTLTTSEPASTTPTPGPPLPAPMQLSPAEIEILKKYTNSSISGGEIRLPEVAPIGTIIGNVEVKPGPKPIPIIPNVPMQPPKPTKVDIGVKF